MINHVLGLSLDNLFTKFIIEISWITRNSTLTWVFMQPVRMFVRNNLSMVLIIPSSLFTYIITFWFISLSIPPAKYKNFQFLSCTESFFQYNSYASFKMLKILRYTTRGICMDRISFNCERQNYRSNKILQSIKRGNKKSCLDLLSNIKYIVRSAV